VESSDVDYVRIDPQNGRRQTKIEVILESFSTVARFGQIAWRPALHFLVKKHCPTMFHFRRMSPGHPGFVLAWVPLDPALFRARTIGEIGQGCTRQVYRGSAGEGGVNFVSTSDRDNWLSKLASIATSWRSCWNPMG